MKAPREELRQRGAIVVGLGFGDEAKGATVDFLVRDLGLDQVLRWNGGPQAQHHVVLTDGRLHVAAQCGAGAPAGASTAWGPETAIDPLALWPELEALRRLGLPQPERRLRLHPQSVVVTPWHRALNRAREQSRGASRHGSTGRGVGEAMLDLERPGQRCLRVADLQDPSWPDIATALRAQKSEQAAAFGPLDPIFSRDIDLSLPPGVEVGEAPGGPAVAEGAHGLLLDRDIGFFPHVTPSRNRPHLARSLLPQAPTIGALRCWMTRHGAGPLPTEDPTLDLQEPHNPWGLHQGAMRWGHLDLVLLRYAIAQGGPIDALALSWLDQLPEELSVCVDWEGARPSPQAQALHAARPLYQRWPRAQLLERLEEALGLPIWICARGPRAADRSWR